MVETFIRERGIYYLLIALCAVGVIGKLYETIIYNRLLKAMENPERTEHPFLKQLKLKYKSHYRLEKKIHNMDAFIGTSIFRYKHLDGIRTFSTRLMLLCVMVSCAGIAAVVYFNMDSWEVVYYALAGIWAVVGLELVDLQCGNGSKRKFLLTAIKDYLENILPNQLGGDKQLKGTQAEELKERTKNQVAASKAPDQKEAAHSEEQLRRQSEKIEQSVAESLAQEKVIADVIKEFFP